MATASEMAQMIGKRVKFPVGKKGDCYAYGTVVNTKYHYGAYTHEIKPDAGEGTFWTQTWYSIKETV